MVKLSKDGKAVEVAASYNGAKAKRGFGWLITTENGIATAHQFPKATIREHHAALFAQGWR